MILLFAAATVLGAPAIRHGGTQVQTTSEFSLLFPQPSGRNGLEEYVRAGDLLKDPSFGVYQSWLPPSIRPSPEVVRQAEDARRKMLESMTPEERRAAESGSNHRSIEEQQLAQRLNGLNYYQLKLEEVQRFQDALDLISRGNAKPFEYVSVPSHDAAGENFVAARAVRQVAKFASDAAFVAFASGDSGRGTEILSQALFMAHRLGSGDIIARLSSIGSMSVSLARFSEHLGAISLPDSKRIVTLASSLLDDRSSSIAMVRNERLRLASALDEGLKNGLLEKSAGTQNVGLVQQYQALSQTQKDAWFNRIHQLVDDQFDALSQRFDSPEENWLVSKEPTSSSSDPKTLEELAASFSRLFSAGIDHDLMLAIVRNRAQVRLLRLHARIIEFRWESGRLPMSLDELKIAREEIYDPLGRRPFEYAVTGATYKLASVGNSETGEVQLRYRAPKNATNSDADRP